MRAVMLDKSGTRITGTSDGVVLGDILSSRPRLSSRNVSNVEFECRDVVFR